MAGMDEWPERVATKIDEVHDEVRAMRGEVGDDRRFLVEMNRRSEIAFQGMMRSMDHLMQAVDRLEARSEELAREVVRLGQAVRENTQATRAHTRAILALLDRFDDGAAPAGGAA